MDRRCVAPKFAMVAAMYKIVWIAPGSLFMPVVVFGQSQAPVTHEALQVEIVQLKAVGWNPPGRGLKYPADIQAAQRALAPKKAQSSRDNGNS
jgi:hypothetical protein